MPNLKPWYLAAYMSNDSKSTKACQAVLVFGFPNWRENNPTDNNRSGGYKYVALPCPTCDFTHDFKRSEWCESQVLDQFCDYDREPDEDFEND